MKACCMIRFTLLFAAVAIAGCVNNEALLHATDELRMNTQSVNDLVREQNGMIKNKASTAVVQSEAQKAVPFLKAIRERCSGSNRIEPNRFMKMIYYYFSDSSQKPRGLSASCDFYTDLSGKFAAQLMLNAGRYYCYNGERENAERALRLVVDWAVGKESKSEINQAKSLLADFDSWDSFTPAWKSYAMGYYETALDLYKANNNPRAMYKVAIMYDAGVGVSKDRALAVQWFLKAADNNYAPAQYEMYLRYTDGNGVEQSKTEAYKWLKKASENGYDPALKAMRSLIK